MKRIKRLLTAGITMLLLGVLLLANCEISKADTYINSYQGEAFVSIESYSISNDAIIPGESFVLSVALKNFSINNIAKNVMINIINPIGVSPKYGTVSQVFVGDIGAGETKNIDIEYDSWASISTNTIDFEVIIVTVDSENAVTLRVPCGTDIPFSILSTNLTESAKVGESISSSVVYRVLGEESLRNVAYVVKVDGEEVVNSSIGILAAGATKTSAATFDIDKEGEYVVEQFLQYSDDSGEICESMVNSSVLKIVPGNDKVTVAEKSAKDNVSDFSYIIMGISGLLIVVLFFLVTVLFRKK